MVPASYSAGQHVDSGDKEAEGSVGEIALVFVAFMDGFLKFEPQQPWFCWFNTTHQMHFLF